MIQIRIQVGLYKPAIFYCRIDKICFFLLKLTVLVNNIYIINYIYCIV